MYLYHARVRTRTQHCKLSMDPEQETLTRINVQLVKCIQRAPKDVADRLKAFLSPEDERYVANDTHDEADKARRIIGAVSSTLELCPRDEKRKSMLADFAKALRSTGAWAGTTVDVLEEEYHAIAKCALNRTTSEALISPASSTASMPSRSSTQDLQTSE